MLGNGIITKHTPKTNCPMHNICVTAACKIPSHTQSTVFYWLGKVNRSITVLRKIQLGTVTQASTNTTIAVAWIESTVCHRQDTVLYLYFTQLGTISYLLIHCYEYYTVLINRAVSSLSLPDGQDFLNPSSFSCKFSHFSSNFLHFLPHFGHPGGRLAHPGRPWLCHCS